MIKQSAPPAREMHWDAELVATDMFWCDLLLGEHFSPRKSQLRSLAFDYRVHLKHLIDQAFDSQRVYLLFRREKVRFNPKPPPRYNFFTKKTKFHFLIGKEQRKTSISIDLKACFFLNTTNPKFILDTHFITLFDNKKNPLTLSIHDFLSSVGTTFGLESKIILAECTCSPYCDPSYKFRAFQEEVARYSNAHEDLLVYINSYNIDFKIKSLAVAPKSGVISYVEKPDDSLFLMLARSFTLYFFDAEQVASIAVKNARENLSRFLAHNHISWIKITHAYDKNDAYTRLNSNTVSGSENHTFTLFNQKKTVIVCRSE